MKQQNDVPSDSVKYYDAQTQTGGNQDLDQDPDDPLQARILGMKSPSMNTYFRDTVGLKGKDINNCNVGVQCNIKIAKHPMLEAVKAELEMVKQILGNKNIEIQVSAEKTSTLETEVKDLKARLEETLVSH